MRGLISSFKICVGIAIIFIAMAAIYWDGSIEFLYPDGKKLTVQISSIFFNTGLAWLIHAFVYRATAKLYKAATPFTWRILQWLQILLFAIASFYLLYLARLYAGHTHILRSTPGEDQFIYAINYLLYAGAGLPLIVVLQIFVGMFVKKGIATKVEEHFASTDE